MPKGPVVYDRKLTIRIPVDLLKALGEIAKVNKATVTGVARIAMERFVDVARREAT